MFKTPKYHSTPSHPRKYYYDGGGDVEIGRQKIPKKRSSKGCIETPKYQSTPSHPRKYYCDGGGDVEKGRQKILTKGRQ